MAFQEASYHKNRGEGMVRLDLATHRRVLDFLNEAIQPQDLIFEKRPPPNPEMDHAHEDNREEQALDRRRILDPDIAREIIEFRDREFPLGFRNVRELLELEAFTLEHLDILQHAFSNSFYGSWSVFPQNIPRRGPATSNAGCGVRLLRAVRRAFVLVGWAPAGCGRRRLRTPRQGHVGVQVRSD